MSDLDIDTRRPALEVARDVAAALGEPWTAFDEPLVSPSGLVARLDGPDGQQLRLKVGPNDLYTQVADRGRIIVTGEFPGLDDYTTGAGMSRMTVSAEKSPALIAREICRRLLPIYIDTLVEARVRQARETAREGERTALLDDAAAVLAVFGEVTRDPRYGRLTVGQYADPVEVELTADLAYGSPTHAKVKVRVNRELLPALVRALATLGAPETAAEGSRCRHAPAGLSEMLMDLCGCGTVLHEGEEYVPLLDKGLASLAAEWERDAAETLDLPQDLALTQDSSEIHDDAVAETYRECARQLRKALGTTA